ncbi:MAG: hypothetical protein HOY79_07410 [Streptomyces sp.]|nr:hypothetical protein [Streptomyces sp.]
MTDEQPPRRPGYSAKVASIRKWAQSPEYQRQVDEQQNAVAAKAEAARQAAAADAEAQHDIIAALAAAGFKVFPDARKGHVTVRLSCTPRTANRIATWVQQHADGGQ